MTHEYTLLVGGIVIRGEGEPAATAIAWAADTILAIGTDAEIRAISRGDSHVVALGGEFVVGLEGPPVIGGAADLAVFHGDPRERATDEPLAVIRGGRMVAGALAEVGGAADHAHRGPADESLGRHSAS